MFIWTERASFDVFGAAQFLEAPHPSKRNPAQATCLNGVRVQNERIGKSVKLLVDPVAVSTGL